MRYFFLILACFFCNFAFAKEPIVLVSISPQKFLVEKIAGSTIEIEVIVPAGASPHSYEPTPFQAIKIQNGSVWFRMGESFEPKLVSLLKNTLIVDQREGIPLIAASCPCHDMGAYDPHFWLDPKLLKKMAYQIGEVLSSQFPEHSNFYKENLAKLVSQIDQLDNQVFSLLSNMQGKTILVSHPAFGYLCKEYGLIQLPIEMEGKEPTAKYLSELYKKAKKDNIRTVFLQKQYNVKGGKKLAHDLHAKIVFLDPYAENVIENIKTIAEAFANS